MVDDFIQKKGKDAFVGYIGGKILDIGLTLEYPDLFEKTAEIDKKNIVEKIRLIKENKGDLEDLFNPYNKKEPEQIKKIYM